MSDYRELLYGERTRLGSIFKGRSFEYKNELRKESWPPSLVEYKTGYYEYNLQHLLKEFVKYSEQWKSVCAVAGPTVKLISSLSSQLSTCERVNLSDTPLRGFADIQQKLRYKIQVSLEEELNTLKGCLEKLKDIEGSVGYYSSLQMLSLKEHYGMLKIEHLATPHNVFVPPISDLLVQVDIARRRFKQEFLRRKYSLIAFDWNESESVKRLEDGWTEDESRDPCPDFGASVKQFMEVDHRSAEFKDAEY